MSGIGNYKYQTNKGNVFYVKLDNDPQVNTIAGDQPAAGVSEEFTIKIHKNTKAVGLQPRHAILGRAVGALGPPAPGNCLVQTGIRYKRIPILTQAHMGQLVTGSLGDGKATTVTIRGTLYTVLKTVGEQRS